MAINSGFEANSLLIEFSKWASWNVSKPLEVFHRPRMQIIHIESIQVVLRNFSAHSSRPSIACSRESRDIWQRYSFTHPFRDFFTRQNFILECVSMKPAGAISSWRVHRNIDCSTSRMHTEHTRSIFHLRRKNRGIFCWLYRSGELDLCMIIFFLFSAM